MIKIEPVMLFWCQFTLLYPRHGPYVANSDERYYILKVLWYVIGTTQVGSTSTQAYFLTMETEFARIGHWAMFKTNSNNRGKMESDNREPVLSSFIVM